MLRLVYLGTAAALPGPDRDNTSLLLDDGHELTLIDASGAPLRRIMATGLPVERLARLVLTHEHVDHVYGLPSLLQSLALAGRREPLPIFALPETWRTVDRLLDAFPTTRRGEPPVERRQVEPGERPFIESPWLSLRAARVEHSAPTIGLRIQHAEDVIAYSSDTGPCDAMIGLAEGCSLLVHEATFLEEHAAEAGRARHSTARQAGAIAAAAGAERLALVHFTPTRSEELEALREEASAVFNGPVSVPADLDRFELG